MSSSTAQDPDYIPPDDVEWQKRIQSSGGQDPLDALPRREGSRPAVFGFIPHRQIERIEKEDSEYQKVSLLLHLLGSY